jgi:hypothetical protein
MSAREQIGEIGDELDKMVVSLKSPTLLAMRRQYLISLEGEICSIVGALNQHLNARFVIARGIFCSEGFAMC